MGCIASGRAECGCYSVKLRLTIVVATPVRMIEAMRQFLETEGHAKTTIDAVARQAEVSVQTVSAILASQTAGDREHSGSTHGRSPNGTRA